MLDAGPTQVGIESTVLDVTRTPMVQYRPGAVTPQQIQAVCGVPVEIYVPTLEDRAPESLPSPGVGIRHYAPRARVVLVEGTAEAVQRKVTELTRERRGAEMIGVLLPVGWCAPEDVITRPWAAWEHPGELAASLFAGLRALDACGVDAIVCPLPAPGDVRDAIRDRLLKAARAK